MENLIMSEVVTKSSIIGRSPSGNAVLAFENEDMARRWSEMSPNHRIRFYRQVITETEIEIVIDVPMQLQTPQKLLA